MMSKKRDTRADLLTAIREKPDDDAPRLALADWLDKHGDPERAEFIRVQCALAKIGPDDPDDPALEEREQQLLDANEARWNRVLPPWARTVIRYVRGFPV